MKYILVAVDYVSKWVEVIALANNEGKSVTAFLKKNIFSHFGTSKMRFFELFIENKNLIKQGLYLLEISQNAAGSTEVVMDRRGHDGPSWTPSSHT